MHAVESEVQSLISADDKYNGIVVKDNLIQSLEKDLEWFMTESLRLDEVCRTSKQEGDIWQAKSEALRDDLTFLETQIGEAQRQCHVLEDAIFSVKKQTSNLITAAAAPPEFPFLPSNPAPALEIAARQRRLAELRAELRGLRSADAADHREKIELETIFISAARKARKNLAKRRQLGRAEAPVFDGLLASDEILTKLYFCLFPHRRLTN